MEWLPIATFVVFICFSQLDAQSNRTKSRDHLTPNNQGDDALEVNDDIYNAGEVSDAYHTSSWCARDRGEPCRTDHIDPRYCNKWCYQKGTYFVKNTGTSGTCTFRGYNPVGPSGDVGTVKSPTIKLQNSVDTVIDYGKAGKTAQKVLDHLKLAEEVLSKNPTLGPALGVFSAVLGGLQLGPATVTPAMLAKKMEEALEELTGQVNDKIRQVQSFATLGDMKTATGISMNHYEKLWNSWKGCIYEPTIEHAQRCEFEKLRDTIYERAFFIHFEDCVMGNEKACNNPHYREYTGKVDAPQKARWLEFTLDVTRDYGVLLVLQATSFFKFNCITQRDLQHSNHYCHALTELVVNELNFLVTYVTNAVAFVKREAKGKHGIGECGDSFECNEWKKKTSGWGWGEWHYYNYNCRCHFNPVADKMDGRECNVQFTIMQATPASTAGHYTRQSYSKKEKDQWLQFGQEWGMKKIKPFAQEYQRRMQEAMQKYWDIEVLSFVPQWKKAVQMILCMTKEYPKTPVIKRKKKVITILSDFSDGESSSYRGMDDKYPVKDGNKKAMFLRGRVKDAIDLTHSIDEPSCEMKNTDLYGYDIWYGTVSSWEECGKKCNSNDECAAWTYAPGSGDNCWIKSPGALSEEARKDGNISGKKNCPIEDFCAARMDSIFACGANQHCVNLGTSSRCECNIGYVKNPNWDPFMDDRKCIEETFTCEQVLNQKSNVHSHTKPTRKPTRGKIVIGRGRKELVKINLGNLGKGRPVED